MAIIESLQSDILEPNTELSSILRKAKVLASELNNIEIKTWVDHELNGYQSKEELPEYRKFSAFNRGNFISYNYKIENIPISVMCIPDETIRNGLQENNIYDGVKSIESIVKAGELNLKRRWPADLIKLYNLCQNDICVDAWKDIPIGFFLNRF